MPVWLGKTPAGDGWRYMHEDGRVEDVDPSTMGMPPGWAPPGFEPDQGQTSYAGNESPPAEAAPPVLTPPGEPSLGVTPLEAPPAAPQATQATPAPSPTPGSAQAGSWRGKTVGPNGTPGVSSRVDRKAAAAAASDMAFLAPAVKAQKGAITGLAGAQGDVSDAQARGFHDESFMLHEQQIAREQEVVAVGQKAARWTSEVQDAINSVPTMDVKRIFKNQTHRESMGMAVAAFMGGFLQPVLGTNTPMDIINKAIDRDIAEQTNDQEMAQRKVWNTKDLAKMDMDQQMWDLGQKDVARLGYLTALQREVQGKVQGYQSAVFKKQGEKLLADVDVGVRETIIRLQQQYRAHYETQRHNQVAESEMSMSRRDANTRAVAAEKAAKDAKHTANFLHGDTGIRAKGPNAFQGGWIAPNEKIREEANGKLQGYNNGYKDAEAIKRLLHGNFGAPGSEERKRAGAAVQRAAFQLMSQVPGLGQKEDMAQMKGVFGGDRDGVFNFASADTARKVLEDLQDSISGNAKSYAKGLQYDPNDSVDWEPPTIAPEKTDTGSRFGDSALDLEGALRGDPELSVKKSLRGIVDEIKAFPGAINDPEARNKMDRAIAVLESMPLEQRTVTMHPGGEAEAQTAEHSGRSGLDWPLLGDAQVDPLVLLKAYRESPPDVPGDYTPDRAAEDAGLGAGYRQFQKNLKGGK